jgi:pimeloyl-ACP methyl ester carboxylesterase/DNA-binding SARP family transcriptional activator
MMKSDLEICLLGELRLIRSGVEVPLPPSRKTRALLAYLVLTGRAQRRERLCEMLWDVPDDPRGSLRWALSKIRALVNDPVVTRIDADRDRVAFSAVGVKVDYLDIKAAMAGSAVSILGLYEMATALGQPLLEGIDLPGSEAFQAWLTAEREEAAALYRSLLERIVLHPEIESHEKVKWARLWHAAAPFSSKAAGALVLFLGRTGRKAEADLVMAQFRANAGSAGIAVEDDVFRELPLVPFEAGERPRQTIGFCTAADGVRIAHASVGSGPAIVKAANWLNHLELDWDGPIWGKTFQALASRNTLVRYDERGNGLSDWDVDDLSMDAFVRDLETVVDSFGLERFPLIGMSQGCAVSIAYAAKHPERVTGLILIGGYATGWRIGATPEERERREAVMTLTRLGWGSSTAAYRHIFSQTFMPDGTPEELAWFDEFQRQTTSAENAVRFQDAFGDIDVRDCLPLIKVPTLVLHSRHDQRIRMDQGRELAMNIDGARFVTLESRNHILLGHEPAWEVARREIELFLSSLTVQPEGAVEAEEASLGKVVKFRR